MKNFERFIERPVLSSVVGLVILLLGLQALSRLNVREYPETTSTTITVITPYIGADAELVRGFVTTPLEQVIATAEGIEYLESSSVQGQSRIRIRLLLGYDPNDAVAEILTKIQQVANQLPDAAEESIVTVRKGEDTAAMYLAFYSEVLPPNRITDYVNRAVRPRLETAQGVQRAEVIGAQTIAMRIWLDPKRMAALDVTSLDVRQAISSSNFLSAVGETKGSTLSIPFKAETNLKSVDAFQRLVIREAEDGVIRLEDLSHVELGSESYNSSVLFEGRPVVFVGVEVAPEANVLESVGAVRKLLPSIREQLPSGLRGLIVYDSTVAIEDSINEVVWALIEALVIVTFVIFLFLGTVRSVLVPATAMPLSLIGAFLLMQMLGYTVNLLTLLALILAIGTVVDDGIVIVENANRHLDDGATPQEAAKRTVRELSSSIVAMNVVVLAVFAPIGFMGGLTGSLFTEFAYTVAGATLVSGVIALTLSPMMCSKLIRSRSSESVFSRAADCVFDFISRLYHRLLKIALNARWIVLAAGAVILVSVYFLFQASKFELAPQEDDGFLIISAQADPNSSLDQLERWTSQMVETAEEYSSTEHLFVVNGGGPESAGNSTAFGGVSLKDWDQRTTPQNVVQKKLQRDMAKIAGLQAVVISPPPLPGAGEGTPIQFIVSSISDPESVFDSSTEIVQQARESGLFSYVDSDLKFDKAQTRIDIDREKAAALGINIDQFGGELAGMLGGDYVNYFSLDGRSYRVIPQVQREFRIQPDQILDYRIKNRTGELIPLETFITLEQQTQPRQLNRFNQLNSATISAVPAPGVSLGKGVEYLRQTGEEILPAGYVTNWAGQSRQYVDENTALLISFVLAVILMYLTLAAQYESYRDPAVMLISVPMSLAGALLFFAAGIVSVNIYTQIGLLALIGSIIRHGILLVEFGNQIQREQGLDRREAIEQAAAVRLRAILMTTLATLVGLIPLLLSTGGPGAASRFAISFTLGVGMLLGTLFTLFVVPALYTVVATRHSA